MGFNESYYQVEELEVMVCDSDYELATSQSSVIAISALRVFIKSSLWQAVEQSFDVSIDVADHLAPSFSNSTSNPT